MKTTEKHVAFLLALLIPILFVGCKSKPFETLPSAAETLDANNPFVGVWMSLRVIDNTRHIRIFMDNNQWMSYLISNKDGKKIPSTINSGSYTIKNAVLSITMPDAGYGPYALIVRLNGDKLQVRLSYAPQFPPTVYRRIASAIEINQRIKDKLEM